MPDPGPAWGTAANLIGLGKSRIRPKFKIIDMPPVQVPGSSMIYLIPVDHGQRSPLAAIPAAPPAAPANPLGNARWFPQVTDFDLSGTGNSDRLS